MGGILSIRGVVRDDSGRAVPDVYVRLDVYEQSSGWDIGMLGRWWAYTDETGSYAFNNARRVQRGTYEVWLNDPAMGKTAYEFSGYWIGTDEVRGNTHVLNATVHSVRGSVLIADIQYQDVDGSIKGFYSKIRRPEPGHFIALMRGISPNDAEYGLGFRYPESTSTIEWRYLAGGKYFLNFTYRRLDGVTVHCTSPTIEIAPGEARRFEYIIRTCPPKSAGSSLEYWGLTIQS